MGRQQRRRQEMRARQRQEARQETERAEPRRGDRTRSRASQGQGIGRATIIGGILVIVIAGAGLVWAATHQPSSNPATSTPQSLASTVQGVKCPAGEQLVYHIHQRLELYDHGKRVTIPAAIGIPNDGRTATCYYWIHVHPGHTEIIHVESPIHKTFTLGNYFAIWKATKSSTFPPGDQFVARLEAVSPSQITVFYNGKRWKWSYRSVPLTQHALITVEIGKPVVPPGPPPNWKKLGL